MTEAEEAAKRVKWNERMSHSMHRLTVPNRPQLLEALGRLAIAHTHLERILRYTVKTLSGLSGPKSLDPTKRKPISDLRKRIKKRFKKHHPTAAETYRLDELLEKTKLLSGKRNSYMHRAWSETEAGQVILHEEDLRLGAAPPEAAIERVASEILALSKQINDARLHGFIHDVVQRQPPNAQETS
jgi:restriction endonuclease Mrr